MAASVLCPSKSERIPAHPYILNPRREGGSEIVKMKILYLCGLTGPVPLMPKASADQLAKIGPSIDATSGGSARYARWFRGNSLGVS